MGARLCRWETETVRDLGIWPSRPLAGWQLCRTWTWNRLLLRLCCHAAQWQKEQSLWGSGLQGACGLTTKGCSGLGLSVRARGDWIPIGGSGINECPAWRTGRGDPAGVWGWVSAKVSSLLCWKRAQVPASCPPLFSTAVNKSESQRLALYSNLKWSSYQACQQDGEGQVRRRTEF